MTVPVRYHCPHCGAVVTVERDPLLADKSVTPYPLEGWEYASPDQDVEAADGIRFVCGESGDFDGEGCGKPFYLNYVRFENGREVEPMPESEPVELNVRPGPRGPRGPQGPSGP